MRLDSEFVRLPLRFDAARLAAEIDRFDESDWRPHPQGFPGNSALPLIAVGGDPANDGVKGPMLPTPHLQACPYLRQVLASFRAVWGRTRLMRLDGDAEATAHVDTHYYWTQHARVHVPIVTHPEVRFFCGDAEVHMAAGESWLFDTWRMHNVRNPRPTRRIHLVADTVGSAAFWELAEAGRRGEPDRYIQHRQDAADPVVTESFNLPEVMTPAELREMIALACDTTTGSPAAAELQLLLARLSADWRAAWARFGDGEEGKPLYRRLLQQAENALLPLADRLQSREGSNAVEAIRNVVIRPALDDTSAPASRGRGTAARRKRTLERPVFVVCSPRSGSTLFFETMARSPTLWTIGTESHGVIEHIPTLHPAERRYQSNRLTAGDATPAVVAQLEEAFVRRLRNRQGAAPPQNASGLRMLEKTPKNALRVPFLAAAFPDALFVYLYRDMRDTISSMLDGWRSERFVTYPKLPGWEGPPWSFLLTPGWRELSGKPLAEVVAMQWSTATRYLLDDLDALPADRWCIASYDALVDDSQQEMERVAAFIGAEWDVTIDQPLPLSRSVLSAPDREKWKRNAADLEVALPLVADVAARARALFASPPTPRAVPPSPASRSANATSARPVAAGQFRSVHTDSFAEILERSGSALILSTYQSGRLITLEALDGTVNTHFRAYPSPMGIAVDPSSLVLGTNQSVVRFRNHPELARATDRGAVFAPLTTHTTGDIRVHELAMAGSELVIVNTRFSCLCTLDERASFKPIWQPSFITELVPEDRCHLNGLAIVDGAARFVTALGMSNEKTGWRDRKASGGILIDVPQNEIVARDLSMPHSPRWYEGRLWVLESGEGRLCTIDPRSGDRQIVAEVPGFARGLAFAGPFAFIGLSQVREHVFDGLPVAERGARSCGVWAVDLRNGRIAGFLRFEGIVQEIFDIQILPGIRRVDFLEPSDPRINTTFIVG